MVRARFARSKTEDSYQGSRKLSQYLFWGVIGLIIILLIAIMVLVYQLKHRPKPTFSAVQPNQQKMDITAFDMPNLLPDTILRFASKAAIRAYTFDYFNYNQQLREARPYFTEAGWQMYLLSVEPVINTIIQNQLFINGVITGIPVITNQGELAGRGQVWRVEIPFLVIYQSADRTTKRDFYVVLSLVTVPTYQNPQGIGIDQFFMAS